MTLDKNNQEGNSILSNIAALNTAHENNCMQRVLSVVLGKLSFMSHLKFLKICPLPSPKNNENYIKLMYLVDFFKNIATFFLQSACEQVSGTR